jgi:hypothetical protein
MTRLGARPPARPPSTPDARTRSQATSPIRSSPVSTEPGSGDRRGAFRGGSGRFKGRVQRAEEPARLQGKRAGKRCSPDRIGAGRSLHGKEAVPGSSPGEGLNTCRSAVLEDYRVPLDQGRARKVGSQAIRATLKTPRRSQPSPIQRSISLQRRGSTRRPRPGYSKLAGKGGEIGNPTAGRALGTGFGDRSRGLFKWRRGGWRRRVVSRSFGRGTGGARVLRARSPCAATPRRGSGRR